MKKLALLTLFTLLSALLAACADSAGGGGPCTKENLTMGPNTFCTDAVSLSKGGTITFVDDPGNGSVHILVIGTNGNASAEHGAPAFGGASGKSLNAGDKWTTPPWNTPGTYHVTCTVHPTTMNLTITVTG